MAHVLAVLPAFFLLACVAVPAVRRRLERVPGATLVRLGIDLAAAAR